MKKTLKRSLSFLLTLAMLLSLSMGLGPASVGAATDNWATVGTAALNTDYTESGGDYTVKTALGLAYIAKLVNGGNDLAGKTVTLANDIDLRAHYWTPIGRYEVTTPSTDPYEFKGAFDGANKAISGLTIANASGANSERNALFGTIGVGGTVQNVKLTDVSVVSMRYGASVAGVNNGTVENCSSSGSISANGGGSDRGTGGIVGTNYGTVSDCHSTAEVYNAYRRAGGIVGYNDGIIEDCWFAGYASSASVGYSGGIAATNNTGKTITNCYGLVGSSGDGVLIGLDNGPATGVYEFNPDGGIVGGGSLVSVLPSAVGHIPVPGHSVASATLSGGSLSFSPKNPILPGTTVAVTPTAALGNAVKAVTVSDGYGKSITAVEANGVYSFVMPNTDVTVGADFGADTTAPVVLTIKSLDSAFADVGLTEAQLRAYETTKTDYKSNSTTYSAVTGIPLSDLLRYVPGGDYADAVYFYSAFDASNPTGSGSNAFQPKNSDHASAMLLWSGINQANGNDEIAGLRTALNGGGGKYWWSNVNTVGVSLPDGGAVSFSVTPSNAATTVTDASGNPIAPVNGVYTGLKQGIAYNYTVSAGGYVTKDGVVTPSSPAETVSVSVALSPAPSDGGSSGNEYYYSVAGYAGSNGSVAASPTTAKAGDTVTLTVTPADGYGLASLTAGGATLGGAVSSLTNRYTFTMPSRNVTVAASFEQAVLTVYAQRGESGTPAKAAVFTKTALLSNATASSAGYAYLYAQNSAWRAIVATELVTLDTLLSVSGVSGNWRSGSYLKFVCDDGPYDKSYPYYANINECRYYIDGATTTAVPAGIAIKWNSGALDSGGIAGIAAGAYDSGKLRFVYGVSQKQYDEMTAAGARSPTGVVSVTVVYEASSVPGGSVGVEHAADAVTEEEEEDEEKDAEKSDETSAAANAAAAAFADVKASDWFAEAVNYVREKGLMNGVGGDSFAPAEKLSRAMLVTILHRYSGEGAAASGVTAFVDVPADLWYSEAVAWASANDIVSGYGDAFGPNDSITREQFAVILYRFASQLGLDTSKTTDISGYEDADSISDWALDAMKWANAEGLITGRTATSFAPGDAVTRAETAILLMRFIEDFVNA
ncbi:MAG: S-layer homology domain-containing protein [Clostridiales Family XIII bacterium]|jgi:hypothetical protein|nr:S-layer homology domain-containing protein [Clostridiales Family XIII bacterium]